MLHPFAIIQTYERRSRFVREGREARYWETITPDMMSDEEKAGTKYVRHQPDYRSSRFNSFIKKLDERSGKQNSSRARFEREIGSPVQKPIPANAKSWMITEKVSTEENNNIDLREESNIDKSLPEPDNKSSFSFSDSSFDLDSPEY